MQRLNPSLGQPRRIDKSLEPKQTEPARRLARPSPSPDAFNDSGGQRDEREQKVQTSGSRSSAPVCVQNARRPPTIASVPAKIGRRTWSGTREAKWLEIIMPGMEPTSSDPSIWKSTDPSHQCPAPAISVSGTACAISDPTMRTIGDFG